MNNRVINDITNYIFVADSPQKSDIIFLPGGIDPAIPEKAAELYKDGFSDYLLPSGGTSVKDMEGFYEKCGFKSIDNLKNYGGDIDTIFMKEI